MMVKQGSCCIVCLLCCRCARYQCLALQVLDLLKPVLLHAQYLHVPTCADSGANMAMQVISAPNDSMARLHNSVVVAPTAGEG
jgi:hypothetical protein